MSITTFESQDAAEIESFLSSAYARMTVRSNGRGAYHHRRIEAGLFSVNQGGTTLPLAMEPLPSGNLAVTLIESGGTQARIGPSDDVFGPGDVYLAGVPDGYPLLAREWIGSARVVVLSKHLLAEAATPDPDDDPVVPTFVGLRPIDGAGAARWLSIASFVERTLEDPGALRSTLIVSGLARLLAATALVSFPNDVLASGPAPRPVASERLIRRAVAYIEAFPDRPLTVREVARAAGATSGALRYAFRRHLDTTPAQYLRRVRLDAARQELRSGSAALSEAAQRWGFFDTEHFIAQYRAAYGFSPGV